MVCCKDLKLVKDIPFHKTKRKVDLAPRSVRCVWSKGQGYLPMEDWVLLSRVSGKIVPGPVFPTFHREPG